MTDGRRKEAEVSDVQTGIVPVRRTGKLQLSFAQRRLWFIHQLDAASPAYNMPRVYRLRGSLDVTALRQAVSTLVARHESFRTTFRMDGDEPVQIIAGEADIKVKVIDLSHLDENGAVEEAIRQSNIEAWLAFDLARGPLLRLSLYEIAPEDHFLAIVMHHVISDGWSMSIFFRELAQVYSAVLNRTKSPLTELPIQYADYAVWQREWLQGDELERQLVYWRAQLSDLAPLVLPTDRPRPLRRSDSGGRVTFEVAERLSEGLRGLARKERSTPFMVLLAAFKVLLSRYSGQRDFAVGSPIAGRSRQEFENLIGFFVNTLVLRSRVEASMSFRSLVRQVRETALDAYSHQDVPFEKLVEELHPERDESRSPLFQVMFVLQNTPLSSLVLGSAQVESLELENSVSKFDLMLTFCDTASGGLSGTLTYSEDLFDRATIERMAHHLLLLMEGVVADPDAAVESLPLLSDRERRQVLTDWNCTEVPVTDATSIQALFEAQVLRRPEATALEFEGQRLTYDELNRRANQLAHALRRQGVRSETLVGLCCERSSEMVVAMLAILKAGGAYVPLDPSYPAERLRFMLADSGVRILLIQRGLIDRLPDYDGEVLLLDAATTSAMSEENPENLTLREHLAYLIYTSGSTGTPKGVLVEHRNVIRLVNNTNYLDFRDSDTFLQYAPISFDAATFEIWGCLLNGSRLVVAPPGALSLTELGDTLRRHHVSVLWLTSGLFHLMVDERLTDLSGIRYLLSGGDVLSPERVQRLLASPFDGTIVNGYGPTENTTFTCCHPMRRGDSMNNNVPIGRPIANTYVYVLDNSMQPVPVGVQGELYIGGDGLARGYHRARALTSERFVPDPFRPGKRIYKSGDVCRYRSDGVIEFVGRLDEQVKIRGYRVEPRETEAAIRGHRAVADCVVTARQMQDASKELIAYVVPIAGEHLEMRTLRSFLRATLPEYMIPTRVLELQEIPLTSNGKIDRSRLPEPGSTTLIDDRILPRTRLERTVSRIWCELLEVDEVGVHDDFFEIGGHSLLAVQVFARIERKTGARLPLAAFLTLRTVERMAAAIEESSTSQRGSTVVPVQTKGTRAPVFLVHGVSSNILHYAYFVDQLRSDQPVYGIEGQGLDGERFEFDSLGALAERHANDICALGIDGPHVLLAYCAGGNLAIEIASQLQERRIEVPLVVLVDVVSPSARRVVNQSASIVSQTRIVRVLRSGPRTFISSAVRFARYVWRRAWFSIQFGIASSLATVNIRIPRPLRNLYLKEMNKRVIHAQTPSRYRGTVMLIKSSAMETISQPDLGWSSFVDGDIEIVHIEGTHFFLTQSVEAVKTLASDLQNRLDELAGAGHHSESSGQQMGESGDGAQVSPRKASAKWTMN